MSATTAPGRPKLHHVILKHAKRPHGMFIIGLVIFALGWATWTLTYASQLPR